MRTISIKKNTRSASQPQPVVFRRKALAIAMAAALAPGFAVAETPWNVEISGGGTKDTAGGQAIGVLPFGGDIAKGSFIGELRVSKNDDDKYQVGGAAGFRSLTALTGWLVGAYGAYDYKKTDADNSFGRVTAGVEAFSQNFDFRANYYWPTDDAERTGLGAGRFNRFSLYRNGIYEDVMEGWDAEVGGLVPISNTVETRAYAGVYGVEGDIVDSDTGWRLRAEVYPMKNLSINAGYQDDDIFGGQWFAQVRYAFGQPSTQGIRTVQERMIDPFRRESILTKDNIESTDLSDAVVINPNVRHVSATAAPGGDGSFENPYQSFADYEASGALPSMIYVHKGDYGLAGPLNLQPGQTLWGQGLSLYGIGGDAYALLAGAPGAIGIQLADNTTVAGIGITADDHAIYGENVQGNIQILNNQIASRYGSAVSFWNMADGTSLASNITISGNVIAAEGDYYYSYYGSGFGIEVYNDVSNGGSVSQALNISGNTIIADNDGIRFDSSYGELSGGSSLTQSVDIVGNTILAGSSAIDFDDLDVVEGSRLDLALNISGNQITTYGDGIEMDDIVAVGSGTSVNRALTISDNTINSGGSGIDFEAIVAVDGAVVVDAVTISGNTITAEDDGIYFDAVVAYEAGASLTQSITISGNTIVAADGYGIGFEEVVAAYDGTLNQTVRIEGNTISSYDSGVYFEDIEAIGAGSKLTQNITISGNNIVSSDYYGVYLDNYASDGGTLEQTILIENNDITAYEDGVYLYNYATGAGSMMTQSVTVTGNAVVSSDYYGIEFDTNQADSGAVLNQTIVVTNNTTDSYYAGVYLDYTGATGDNSVVNQNVTISGNTVTVRDDQGIGFWYSEADGANASLTQNVTITGNTVLAPYDEGIDFESVRADGSGATVTQNIVVSGNNVTSGEGGIEVVDGAYAYNGGAVNTTVAITGNVIDTRGDDGIRIWAEADDAGSSVVQNYTISGNTVTALNDDGILIYNEATGGAAAVQAVAVTGNTVLSGLAEGVTAFNYGDGIQNLTISGNTITGAAGVYLYSDTANQLASISGNSFLAFEEVVNAGSGVCTGTDCPTP